jgi:hypothetical protein
VASQSCFSGSAGAKHAGQAGRHTLGRGTFSAALVSSQLFDSLKRSCLSCARVAASPAAAARNAASGVGGHGPESNMATTTSGAHFRKWVRARRPRTSLPQHGHVCRVSSASAALKRGACGGDCRLALFRSGDAAAPLHVRMHTCALFGRAERQNATRIGARVSRWLSSVAHLRALQEARTLVSGACHGRPCACALTAAVLSKTRGRLLVRSHTTHLTCGLLSCPDVAQTRRAVSALTRVLPCLLPAIPVCPGTTARASSVLKIKGRQPPPLERARWVSCTAPPTRPEVGATLQFTTGRDHGHS